MRSNQTARSGSENVFFRAKDIMTVGNIISGFASILFMLHGNPESAKLMIVLAIIFDLADGYVARTFFEPNKFGGELDNTADLISYNIAPSVIVYGVLQPYNQIIAFLTGATIISAGTIRLARFNVNRMEVPGFFIGLPRPISAVLIISYLNSNFFTTEMGEGFSLYYSAAFFIAISLMNLTTIPYPGHHHRKIDDKLRYGLIGLAVIGIISYLRQSIWEFMFITLAVYVISPWIVLEKKQWSDIEKELEQWTAKE